MGAAVVPILLQADCAEPSLRAHDLRGIKGGQRPVTVPGCPFVPDNRVVADITQRWGRLVGHSYRMSSKLPLPLKVPPDVWKWVRAEAASRRMPVGNYVLELLRRGILDETVERTVLQAKAALDQESGTRELLRQVLVLRHLQEAMLGTATWSALFPEAAARAEADLAKLSSPAKLQA